MSDADIGTDHEMEHGRLPTDAFQQVSETLIHQGAVVAFYEVEITDRSGSRFQRDVIRHPGAVSVIPFDGENVTLVRQYRASIDAEMYEIPAGKRDVSGEPPAVTALRELGEEVGLRADSIELVANIHHSPGFCDEYGYIFVAKGLSAVETQREGPEEQAMTVLSVSLDEAVTMCLDGRITDSKSLVGLLALAERERRER